MSPNATRQNELLDQLAAGEALEAKAFAVRMRQLTELAAYAHADAGATGVEQFAAMEVAGTCRMSKLAASLEMAHADRYVTALPLTLQSLAAGELFVRQARALYDSTEHCSEAVARRVERIVLSDGGAELAPPDLRRKARKAVLQVESDLDADEALQRLQEARAGRRVTMRPELDGMASAKVITPAEQLRQWAMDLDRLVLQEKARDREAGVWRSADQIRTDLVMGMPGWLMAQRAAEGNGAASPRKDALVSILVPVATVLERGNEPAELDGYGPISAEHVRLLLPDAQLRRACVDADTGRLVELDDEVLPPSGDAETARERILAMLRPSVATSHTEPQHDRQRSCGGSSRCAARDVTASAAAPPASRATSTTASRTRRDRPPSATSTRARATATAPSTAAGR